MKGYCDASPLYEYRILPLRRSIADKLDRLSDTKASLSKVTAVRLYSDPSQVELTALEHQSQPSSLRPL